MSNNYNLRRGFDVKKSGNLPSTIYVNFIQSSKKKKTPL